MKYGALLLLLLFFACKDYDGSVLAESVSAPSAEADMMMVADVKVKPTEVKVIREGNLRFETADLDDTYKNILSAVRKYKGNIENDNTGKDGASLFRTVTVRIPSTSFEPFITDVSKGVGFFDRKELSARDVTEEFIDMSARLKTKKQLEERYLELLKRANKVSEILEIQKELSAVREDIESQEGQLKYLESRVSMSTVSIEFYKVTAAEAGMTISYGSKMWNAIKSGFNAFSGFLIAVLYMWPFIVILVVLFFIFRRKLRNRKPI